jgi:hypothetical protein
VDDVHSSTPASARRVSKATRNLPASWFSSSPKASKMGRRQSRMTTSAPARSLAHSARDVGVEDVEGCDAAAEGEEVDAAVL